MLNWLSSKLGKARGEQHPLGSVAAIRHFLEQLRGQDPVDIIGEIGGWLGDDGRLAAELPPAASRRAIRALDEFAQAALDELWAKLFTNPDEEVAEAPRMALATYYGHAAAAYRMAVAHFPPGPTINPLERGELCLFMGRALTMLSQRNRLNRFRYRSGGTDHWSAVHELYRTARTRNALAVGFSLYDQAPPTTVEGEYLHGLMFEVAPLDNMAPRQMEIVERYLRQVAGDLLIRDSASEQAPFIVDFHTGLPPHRWHPGLATPNEGFFFGPGDAWQGMLRVLNLLQQEVAPAWLASIPINRQTQAEALLLLRDHWSPQPPQRQAPRSPEEGALLVVQGFGQVRRMVAVSAYVRSGRKLGTTPTYNERTRVQQDYFGSVADTTLLVGKVSDSTENLTPIELIRKLEEGTAKDTIDHWLLADSSSTGIGAIAPLHRSWLHVGALIGYRRENAVYWQVAIVRRLGRNPEGKRLVGIQLLAGIPQPAHVKAVSNAELAHSKLDGSTLSEFDDAILLSTDAGTLLVEPSHVVGDLVMIAGEKIRLVVKLAERIDGTGEFKLFRYEPA